MEVSPLPADIVRKHLFSVRELDGPHTQQDGLIAVNTGRDRISSQSPVLFEASYP